MSEAGRFDADTAVERVGPDGADGRYRARIDPGWWVVAGPNGGYIAAILLRALGDAVGDPERAPRSLTIHYTEPPAEGPVEIDTRIERAGGALSTVSGRLLQEGRPVALCLAAFSKARRGGQSFDQARMPEVPPPERCPPMAPRIPIHERYEQRWAIGPLPFSGGDTALSGGWIRLAGGATGEAAGGAAGGAGGDARPVDALALAAFADAFPPALFSTLAEGAPTGGVPTVDLTVHFRSGAAPMPHAWTLAVFRSRVAREGFLEEDGELWSPDGTLLAQSRQLALAR